VSTKRPVLWDVLYILRIALACHSGFKTVSCILSAQFSLHTLTLKMEKLSSSETSPNFSGLLVVTSKNTSFNTDFLYNSAYQDMNCIKEYLGTAKTFL
jgi:hypothetical protein